jgi:hypothetical protein
LNEVTTAFKLETAAHQFARYWFLITDTDTTDIRVGRPGVGNVKFHTIVIPCMPVCKPEVPDCLDGPLVVLGDIKHERDVCLYDNMPIMLNQESMNNDSVEFHIANTWPTNSDISSISVS